jgi:predicted acylesterase/phospholipase RssA
MTGLYHIGHVLGLLEAGVLPDIISGTSGGSVIGSILCTRTDDEIRRDLNPQVLITKLKCFSRPWPERVKSLWENGNLFSFDDWMERIQWYVVWLCILKL